MSLEEILKKLNANSKDDYEEVVRLLIKIADNILKDPNNTKLRSLKKSNVTVSKKIVKIRGGLESLKFMGFIDNGDQLLLPGGTDLNKLKVFKERLLNRNFGTNPAKNGNEHRKPEVVSCSIQTLEKPVKRVVLAPFTPEFNNTFLRKIESNFHRVLVYEDADLQERARSFMPIHKFESDAQNKLRNVQQQIKAGKFNDPDISLQDLIILELLSWFKGSFFSWVDNPDCEKCGGKTRMSHMCEDTKKFLYADRVEMHVCDACHTLTPFPRYNDPNILLETRKGRCGEWANVFTLFCRSMGWDTRYVLDETDHVWTEVYSFSQKRWLHCDPCENSCDAPLMYEQGWGKKLSYIIAYSSDEVQDVSWRYSSDHKSLLTRRTLCTEEELIEALITLRNKRQEKLSEGRRAYLTKRCIQELVQMMFEKKPEEAEKQGRTSGSLNWRMLRGETGLNCTANSFVWVVDKGKKIVVRYSSVSDKYELICDGEKLEEQSGWNMGVFEAEGIFRKEEKDWKKVYLARNEGYDKGIIKWKFTVDDKPLQKISVDFKHSKFETGQVDIEIQNGTKTIKLEADYLETECFSGSDFIVIEAELHGGNGDVAWQHAQLFRESMEDPGFSLVVTFTFDDLQTS